MNDLYTPNLLCFNKLLHQAEVIFQKYENISQYTGEHFNIFSILDLNSKELIHSKFIGYLLNPKGQHQQNDLFLNLFLDYLKSKFEFEKIQSKITAFNTPHVNCVLEKFIGSISLDEQDGGRIDILLTDHSNTIIIENKIDAIEQPYQLVRYKRAYPDSILLYLSLFGDPASTSSASNLTLNQDYFCLSYETDILAWISLCIKECSNQPYIRETLNQYADLIKNLTNQTTNDKMQNELINLILENKNSMQALLKANHTLLSKMNQTLRELHFQINQESIFVDLNTKIQIYDPQLNIQITDIKKDEVENHKIDIFYLNVFYSNKQIFFLEVFENPQIYQIETGIWSKESLNNSLNSILEDSQIQKYNYNQGVVEICNKIIQNLVVAIKKINTSKIDLSTL